MEINQHTNNPLGKEEFTNEIRKYFKLNDNSKYQNLYNAAKAVFKGNSKIWYF